MTTPATDPRPSSRRPIVVAGLVTLAGLALLVAGIVGTVEAQSAGFGWFAYAPLSDQPFSSSPGRGLLVEGAPVLLAVGAALTAGGAGFAFGRLWNPAARVTARR